MNQDNDPRFDGVPAPNFFDLRLENELLKLKMQAELGAQFGTFANSPELDPIMERQFLEQILEFERLHETLEPVTIREYLGNPEFRPAAALDAAMLNSEWKRLTDLYDEKGLGVDFIADYPLSVMYDFMSGELLDQEVEPMPGWCFIYEEFHPNHEHDLRERTKDFMSEFFSGTFCEETFWDGLVTPIGEPCALPRVQTLLDRFHSVIGVVKDWDHDTSSLYFEPETPGQADVPGISGKAVVAGVVRYAFSDGKGAEDRTEGAFSLTFQCTHAWWSVATFQVHGFSWAEGA